MAFTRTHARFVAALVLAAAAIVALPIVQAAAAVVPVSSRAALNGDVTINWDLLGPPGDFSTPPRFPPTVGPVTVSPGSSLGELRRVDGGFGFEDGEPLVRDRGSQVDTFLLTFDQPVRGFGFDLQATVPSLGNGDFSGVIAIRDTSFNEIGTVPFASNIDLPPIFVGGLSDAADIFQLSILVDFPSGPAPLVNGGFAAINRLDVVSANGGSTSVPVPATWALLLAPLAGFALTGRRRRA